MILCQMKSLKERLLVCTEPLFVMLGPNNQVEVMGAAIETTVYTNHIKDIDAF